MNAQTLLKSQACSTILHERPVLRIEIHKPHMPHALKASGCQSMGADTAAEIEHIPMGELLLQPQRVSDVVGTAEMPGRQLEQVTRPNGVLIEIRSSLWIEGSRMHRRQVLRALG